MNNILEQVISWIPYIYLVSGVVLLLVYGVIGQGSRGRVSTMNHITDLTILLQVNTLLLSTESESVIRMALLGFSIMILIASKTVIDDRRARIEDYEFGLLASLSLVGLGLMVSAKDLVMIYLAIETMSLSLYIMACLRKTGQYSTEAGLKYIVLGALSSGIILIGISQIYVQTGTVELEGLSIYIAASEANIYTEQAITLGELFIIIALMFKLGVAPLHMWVPDVYEGAPSIITMFFAVVPKLGVAALLISLVSYSETLPYFKNISVIIGILSIIVGSLGAINQTKIKRILAYSAIAHMGWVLLGIGIGTQWGLEASVVYLILYMLVGLVSFGAVLNIYQPRGNNYVIELSGLARRSPVIAFTLSMALLSTAGIPPLAGFYSKYTVIIGMLEEGWLIASILAIVSSVVGAFYYVRIIQLMYFNDSPSYLVKELAEVAKENSTKPTHNIGTYGVMGGALYLITTFLLYPNPVLVYAHQAVM